MRMTAVSTTIRVTVGQRERLRELAEQRVASMADTLDAALEALRRNLFYEQMAQAEVALQQTPEKWSAYVEERDAWLHSDVSGS
jgi:hypothetical protein